MKKQQFWILCEIPCVALYNYFRTYYTLNEQETLQALTDFKNMHMKEGSVNKSFKNIEYVEMEGINQLRTSLI